MQFEEELAIVTLDTSNWSKIAKLSLLGSPAFLLHSFALKNVGIVWRKTNFQGPVVVVVVVVVAAVVVVVGATSTWLELTYNSTLLTALLGPGMPVLHFLKEPPA